MNRFFSTASKLTTKISNLPSDETKKISQTSIGLYRILHKIVSNHAKRNNFVLLQPPLDHRDYGQARVIDAEDCSIFKTSKNGENDKFINSKILSFVRHWTRKNSEVYEEEERREVGNFHELFGMTNFSGGESDDVDESVEKDFSDLFLYISTVDLKHALRVSFNTAPFQDSLTKKDVVDMQRLAIDSITLLEEQGKMLDRTSISFDEEKKIRVTATSKCIGVSNAGPRFAYRIRIENFNEPHDDDHEDDNSMNTSFQLLGRTWIIVEDDSVSDNSTEEIKKNKDVVVDAPTTGAVGSLPVIHPGEIFEYMSGCELATTRGHMKGCFHMAMVDKHAQSAQVGDPIEAFSLSQEKRFELPVEPFNLIAEDT